MGGSTEPFQYDKPSSYTFGSPTSRPFNPKAVTHASWTPPAPRAKHDGPLINFNKHPDSYIQAPYGRVNVQPMDPKTKGCVRLSWKTQRILRILALIGSIGAVFCIVTIRQTTGSVGWIIRVGPTIALFHTIYAVYFLCRAPTSRPPTSCASYQVFAGLLDTGLIPFFAFSAYMAWEDYTNNMYGWTTVFNKAELDRKIIHAFWIVCAVEISLVSVSLVFDVYLAMVFKKIARMPPDLNPLEEKDNLTARPHHKRNKSELLHEKYMSSSTLASQRFSQQSQSDLSARRIPFTHTRTDSADREVAFNKDILDELRDPYTGRTSISSSQQYDQVPRPRSAVVPPPNARSAGAGLGHRSARSSNLAPPSSMRPLSWMSHSDYEGMPAETDNYTDRELERNVRAMSPVSAMSDVENHSRELYVEPTNNEDFIEGHKSYAHKVSSIYEHDMSLYDDEGLRAPPAYVSPHKRSLQPLAMNPPTPVKQEYEEKDLMVRPLSFVSPGTPPRSALRETDNNLVASATPSSRPASFVGSGTKSRFYGNLRSSIGGSPTRLSRDSLEDLGRSNTVKSDESGNFEVYGSDSDDEYDQQSVQHGAAVDVVDFAGEREWNGQRQISNSTGFDLHTGYAGLDPEFGKGMARRREVSGKVAEEGRSYVITASNLQPEPKRPGAAGWARFGGL